MKTPQTILDKYLPEAADKLDPVIYGRVIQSMKEYAREAIAAQTQVYVDWMSFSNAMKEDETRSFAEDLSEAKQVLV